MNHRVSALYYAEIERIVNPSGAAPPRERDAFHARRSRAERVVRTIANHLGARFGRKRAGAVRSPGWRGLRELRGARAAAMRTLEKETMA